MITIVYSTFRRECHIEWFFDSLHRECGGNYNGLQIVVVDFYALERSLGDLYLDRSPGCIRVPPKPSVWQGANRITKHDFFDAANARNTGICYAKDGYVALVDDLSVLMPGWLGSVRQAMAEGYIVCGAFQKVKHLNVSDGQVQSFEDFPSGHDNSRFGRPNEAVVCPPNWMYGCSLAAPVQAFLDINGYPEDLTAGMGYEDSIAGITIEKHGYAFKYDTRMLTLESEDHHHNQANLLRRDPGESPSDKSHAMMSIASGITRFSNYFGEGFSDLAQLRNHILGGGQFPIRTKPTHEWFTGVKLSELE